MKLQEFHCYMFRPRDLERQVKGAFFNGLHPEHQLMVMLKWDDPRVNIMQLLAAIRECEENQENNWHNRHAEYSKVYLPLTARTNNNYCNHHQNTHTCPSHTLPQNQNQDRNHYCQDNRNLMIPIQAIHADPDVHIQVNNDYLPPYIDYDNPNYLDQLDPELTLYTQFYKAVMHLADSTERRDRHCYNCKEPGYFWCDCQKSLKGGIQTPDGSCMPMTGRVKQEWGSQSKGWPSPPGGTSTATAHGISSDAHCSSTVNNNQKHPSYWNDDPCARWLGPLMGTGREC